MKILNLKFKIDSGITLLEVLISITILTTISFITYWYFSGANEKQALIKEREALSALLAEARSLALSSKNASLFGVQIEEFQAILFEGAIFSPSDPQNITHQFHNAVHVSALSVNGGGNAIVFSRLSGETDNFGTVTLSLVDDPLSSTVINVQASGVIE